MKFLVLSSFLLSLSSGVLSSHMNPCSDLPMGTGFVNDYTDCSRYFSCVDNVPHSVSCPQPLHFDATRHVCDSAANSRCNACPATGIVSMPVFNSCTRWTLCVNGHAVPQECTFGTTFNREIGSCDLSENVQCSHDLCRDLQGGNGFAPLANDCNSFAYCYMGNQARISRCQPGLSFDHISRRCVPTVSARCFEHFNNVNALRPRPANLPIAPIA